MREYFKLKWLFCIWCGSEQAASANDRATPGYGTNDVCLKQYEQRYIVRAGVSPLSAERCRYPRLRICDTGIWRVTNWFIIINVVIVFADARVSARTAAQRTRCERPFTRYGRDIASPETDTWRRATSICVFCTSVSIDPDRSCCFVRRSLK